MANQQSFTSQDIERMKNDAIRRARQMQSRATIVGGEPSEREAPRHEASGHSEPRGHSEPSKSTSQAQKGSGGGQGILNLPFLNSFSSTISRLGLTSEQLIIFAIILMLCESRENRLLIMALIYIAL